MFWVSEHFVVDFTVQILTSEAVFQLLGKPERRMFDLEKVNISFNETWEKLFLEELGRFLLFTAIASTYFYVYIRSYPIKAYMLCK